MCVICICLYNFDISNVLERGENDISSEITEGEKSNHWGELLLPTSWLHITLTHTILCTFGYIYICMCVCGEAHPISSPPPSLPLSTARNSAVIHL